MQLPEHEHGSGDNTVKGKKLCLCSQTVLGSKPESAMGNTTSRELLYLSGYPTPIRKQGYLY